MITVDAWNRTDGHCNVCKVDEYGVSVGTMPRFTITVGGTIFRLCWEHWRELQKKVREESGE